jgi:hypothetical protein
MNAYLIGYDLNRPGQYYTDLIEAIKKIGNWWHCLDSTWIVKTNSTAVQIRDYLTRYLDTNDELLVVCLSGDAAWRGFDNQCSSWLKENL